MNCKVNKNIKGFNHIYKSYFKAWDYNFSKENVDFKELTELSKRIGTAISKVIEPKKLTNRIKPR